MDLDTIRQLDRQYLFQNFGNRQNVCFTRGKGSVLFDTAGRRYIDFLSGIAVCSFGHADEEFVHDLTEQMGRIMQSSNHYFNREQALAAQDLSTLAFPGRTLFVNSGTEANEAAIKLTRRYGLSKNERRFRIATFNGSFHGRTFASMTATGQKKIHEGFGPLVPGFCYHQYNSLDGIRKEAESGELAGVIFELIQGEGGVIPADRGFVHELRALCTEQDIVLIVDEIQTGIGRTGHAFAFQHYGIEPDMVTLAKGLGGGFPVGALHAAEKFNEHLPAGSHGTTFGGNHLAMAAVRSVLKRLTPSLMEHVNATSALLFNRINTLKEQDARIRAVRGIGVNIGIELSFPAAGLVKAALEAGLVINATAGNVIRFLPALNITRDEAEEGLAIFENTLKNYNEATNV